MKKITIITALLIIAGTNAFAAEETSVPNTSIILYHQPFTKIVVENDIDILLTEGAEKSMQFSGDETDIKKAVWEIKDGTFYLKSTGRSLKNKVVLTINVSGLNNIFIYGSSDVCSAGRLQSKRLKVYIDGDGMVNLKNTGSIKIAGGGSTELNIKKLQGDISID